MKLRQERPYKSPGIKEMTMEVKLIGISLPVEMDNEGINVRDYNSDALLAEAGRTCYQSFDKASPENDRRLVAHMGAIGHYSVLEHVVPVFRIRGGSRAFTHQLVRHRHTGYSQESQRYCDEGNFGYIIPPSIKEAGLEKKFVAIMEQCQQNYLELQKKLKSALDEGRIPKHRKVNEDARFVIPNAVQSEIVISPNFAELRHMFKKRLTTHAQWEIHECFRQILLIVTQFSSAFDDINSWYEEHGNLNDFRDKG